MKIVSVTTEYRLMGGIGSYGIGFIGAIITAVGKYL